MSNTAQLRQKARSLEQREQWKPALELYEQMTSSQPEGEDLDVGIWNRIGDLHMRLAQSEQAVSAYERAVQAYADAGLHNNAIALCNKILRLTPGRPPIYLKLALISALKGFLADARQHLSHYLERLNAAGQLEVGLQTLIASADAHPEDAAEVRRVIAEQLHTHEQTGDALRLFRAAHRALVERGQAVEAERVLAQIQQCEARWIGDQAAAPAPAAPAPAATPSEPTPEPAAEPDLELEIVSGDESLAPQQTAPSSSELEPPAAEIGASADLELSDISVLNGFETTARDLAEDREAAAFTTAEGLEPTPPSELDVDADPVSGLDELGILDFGDTGDADVEALPLLSFDSDHAAREQLEAEPNPVAAADGLLPTWEDTADGNIDSLAQDESERDRTSDAFGVADSFDSFDTAFDLGFNTEAPAEPLPFLDTSAPGSADQTEAEEHAPDALEFGDEAEPLPFLDRPDDSEQPQSADDLVVDAEGFASPETGQSTAGADREAFEGSGWSDEASADTALPQLGEWAVNAADSEWDTGEDLGLRETAAEEPESQAAFSENAAESLGDDEVPGQAHAAASAFEDAVADPADTPIAEPLPSFLAMDEPVAARPQAEAQAARADSAAEENVPLDTLRARLAAAPGNRGAVEQLRARLRQVGMDDESHRVLEAAVQSLTEQGLYAAGVAVLRVLLELTAAATPQYQRQVELAFRADDSELLIRAYLDLAAHLQADGEPAMVRAVYERVLELDADNQHARRALGFPEAPVAKAHAEGEYVDLAALIMDDDEQPSSTRFVVEAEEPSGDEDKDFAEILARFREQVAQNIDANDSASHYDLGVAFKEMGLFDEAISEFQTAIRAGANPLATLEVLGECFVAQEQYAVGWRVLDRAVRVSAAADAELVGVVYWMGRCDEALGRGEAAAECYERVLSVDIRFRDTAERLRALRGSPSVSL